MTSSDAGGFDWTIKVRDEFSKTTKALAAELESARAAFDLLRQDSEKLRAEQVQAAQAMREVGKASKALADKTKDAAKQSRKKAKELTVEEEALRKVEKAERRAAVTAKAVEIARARGVVDIKNQTDAFKVEEAALRRLANVMRRAAVEERSLQLLRAQGLDGQGRRIKVLSDEEIAENKLREAIRKRKIEQLQADLAAQQGLDAQGRPLQKKPTIQESAESQLAKELDDLRKRRALADLKQLSPEYRKLAVDVRRAEAQLRAQNREWKVTEGRLNRVSFTFRRLFGILAAFAVARTGIRGFVQAVRDAVDFNAQVETAELGVRSLVVAVGEVRTAFGTAVPKAQQLALAQTTAAEQIKTLRLDAQQTAATFTELAEAFQVGLAPGLEAGLNIDQVRKFAVQISQAASALGLAQNQLSEEIRAILGGTIQQRTTRIASALGVTNEDIRGAKQAGNLFEFLQTKFEAFTIAGEEAQKTFAAQISNTRDALLQLIGTGAIGFFEEIKQLLFEIQDASLSGDGAGGLVPSDRGLQVVRALFEGLRRSVSEARTLAAQLELRDAVSAARAIGEAVVFGARLLRSLIVGVIAGFRNALSIAGKFKTAIEGITGVKFDSASFDSIVQASAEILTTWLAINTLVAATRGPAVLLVNIFTGVVTAAKGIPLALEKARALLIRIGPTLSKIFSVPTALLVGGILAAVRVVQDLVQAFTGTEVKLGTIVRIVRVTLVEAIRFAASILENSWTLVTATVSNAFEGLVALVRGSLLLVAEKTLDLIGLVSSEAATAARNLAASRRELEAASRAAVEANNAEITGAVVGLGSAFKDVAQNLYTGIGDAIRDNSSAAADLGGSLADNLRAAIGDFVPDLNSELEADSAAKSATTLGEILASYQPILLRSAAAFDANAKKLQDLIDTAADLRLELDLQPASLGLDGAAEKLAREVTEARVNALETERSLLREQQTLRNKLAQVQERTTANLVEQNRLSDAGRFVLARSAEAWARLTDLQESSLVAQAQVARAEADLRSAQLRDNKQDLEDAQRRQDAALRTVELVKQERASTLRVLDSLQQQISDAEGPEAARRLGEVLRSQLDIIRDQVAASEELKTVEEALGNLRSISNTVVERRIALLASEEAFNLRRRAALEGEEAAAEARLAIAERTRRASIIETTEAYNRVRLLQVEASVNAEQRARDLQALQLRREQTSDLQAQLEIEKLIAAEQEAGRLAGELTAAQLERATAVLARQQQILKGTFSEGLSAGLKEWADEAPTLFEAGVSAIKTSAEATISGLSSGVVDALTGVEVDVAERIGAITRSIAQAILENYLRAGLAKAFTDEGANAAARAVQQAEAQKTVEASQSLSAAAATLTTPAGTLSSAATGLSVASQGLATAAQTLVPSSQPLVLAVQGLAASLPTLTTAGTSLATAAPSLSTAGAILSTSAPILNTASVGLSAVAPVWAATATTLLQAATLLAFGSGAGFAQGGEVPRSTSRPPSPAHASARGFARGRPAGLDPRDTIPAWLSPGEWVIRPESVQRYGSDLFRALNEGRIDPLGLRAMLGDLRSSRKARAPKSGFATGGLVDISDRKANRRDEGPGIEKRSRAAARLSTLVVDGRVADQILAASRTQLERFNRERRQETRLNAEKDL